MTTEEFPRRFGPYVLVKSLGRGGMGALCLAVHGQRGMEKVCVVKTALPHLADKGYLQRFRDEAKTVVRLSHGNLVTVFDAGQVKGEIFLAMDFIEGKDLRAVWNRCAQKGIAFPIPVAVHIVKELVRGLGYAHTFEGLSLVHRDVSPPNVLLSYSGEVKLTDFGLATSTIKLERTAPGIIYGKVSYMAPEQARGDPLDGRTDLYAASIILWELLTGRQLFPAHLPGPRAGVGVDSDEELIERVRRPEIVGPSRRASRVPPDLDEICCKALALDPKDRYQSGEDFRSALAAYLAKTAPSTDGAQVAAFLRELFGDQIATERSERESSIVDACVLLSSTSKEQLDGYTPVGAAPHPMEVEARPGVVPPEHTAPDNLASPATSDQIDENDTTRKLKAAEEISRTIGTVLAGRYRIRRLCGEGGMGRVYEAEHVDIGKRVAVKVLHPAYTRTPDVVERFRREARAASKIGHPNIVNVTDSGTTEDGSFFFVMEYIEGIELGLAIHNDGPLGVKRALKIVEQMCEALQAAHDAGVIHRDLKPENVLLVAREGQIDLVKVLDFGIAKSTEMEESTKASPSGPGRRLTRPGVAMGTPEYMAPEQAAGRPADPRSDIYAVGSILYEMLTGVPPYEGDNVMEVLHKKANQAPTPLRTLRPDVPIEVEALVDKAMARVPSQRPESMGQLAREVTELAATIAVSAASSGPRPLVRSRESPLFTGAIDAGASFAGLSPTSRRALVIGASALVALGALAIARVASSPSASTYGGRQAAGKRAPVPVVRPPAPPPAPVVAPPPVEAAQTLGAAQPLVDGTPSEAAPAAVEASEANPQTRSAPRGPGGESAGTNKKLLQEAQELLKGQKLADARQAFSRVLASGAGRQRGVALVGLGHVAFQEKNYDQAVSYAKDGARAGGGLDARILLGEAYFRLERYAEAKKAFGEVLRTDPKNQRAKSGLELVARRME